MAQSSSLYTTSDQQRHEIASTRYDLPTDHTRRHLPDVHPDVPRLTLYVDRRPEPREFMINDLVTIIVAESLETELDSEVSTERATEVQ